MKRIGRAAGAVFGFVSNNPRTSAVAGVVALALCFAAWQFGAGVVAGVRGALGRAHVGRLEAAATKAEGEAGAALEAAAVERVERKVEDRIRAEVIDPERSRASARVETARARRREAARNYEKAIRDPALPATDDAALFTRNCADYARLYPGRRRRGCR